MESLIVNIERLSHHFKGQKVLDDISLHIRKGSIYGFLGPNGAGKTTTLRLLLGLLEKQHGKISIFGSELFMNRINILKQVGSLIEMPSLYAHLTGAENLEIFRLSYQTSKKRISAVLEIAGLSNAGKKKVRSYSLGMKQRLGIALTLLHDPELLILDEPTNGLDPEGIIDMRNLLKRLNREFGKTILISSHLLSEVEKIITDVAIIHLGKILFEGTFSDLQQKKARQLIIQIEVNDIPRTMELLKDRYSFTHKDGKLLTGYRSNAANSAQYRQIPDTIFNQSLVNKSINKIHNFKAGTDYTIDSKQTIGIMANGALFDNTLYSNSKNVISDFSSGKIDKLLIADNMNTGKRHNINTNINYRFADTIGHELNLDANYGFYRINTNQFQPNYYYNASGDSLAYTKQYNLRSPTSINIYNTKADYGQNAGKGRLGLGVKSSYVSSSNKFRRFNMFVSDSYPDSAYTNDFHYKENINAFYLNYNRTYKSFKIQAGIRVENTNVSANSSGYKNNSGQFSSTGSSFNLHYANLFPSAAMTLNKNPDKQWSLTYSYRIDRPAYRDLNPFEFKIDDYTSRKGNTGLQPQFINSLGLSFLYTQSLTTTLNYSYIKDVFTVLWDTTNRSKAFITKRNMSSQQLINLNISYPFQYKWYGLFANITTYYTKYKSDFGPGRTIDLNAAVLDANADQTFTFGKGWSGQLTAYYTSPSIVQGNFKIKEQWSADGGFRKNVLQNAGKLSLTVTDVFNTSRFRGSSIFSGQQVISYNKEETRQLRIFFSYRFGNKKARASRQRETGVEEEKSRSF